MPAFLIGVKLFFERVMEISLTLFNTSITRAAFLDVYSTVDSPVDSYGGAPLYSGGLDSGLLLWALLCTCVLYCVL